MPETVYGNGTTIEDAVADAISEIDQNHISGEVRKILVDRGGVRGGVEFRVEVRVNG
ncbi:MAG: hypothetical protein M3467_03815 [Actinomycetota bacterium]|jgi:hypothetical protein|nr:hypothetical protein [Euzebyaceae bacterium]MDQ3431341.1 hypothetical protein [Actinomycetota bacterium]